MIAPVVSFPQTGDITTNRPELNRNTYLTHDLKYRKTFLAKSCLLDDMT